MGQHASVLRDIDPSQVRVADTEGSLVLGYKNGNRSLATLPGSVMNTMGHYLNETDVFEELLMKKCRKISRPLPYFLPHSLYIPKEYQIDPDDKHAAAQRGFASVGLGYEKKQKEEPDLAELLVDDVEAGVSEKHKKGKEERTREEANSLNKDDALSCVPENSETQEEMETRIEQERILHDAIQQRKIFRLVSQYPVYLTTPFADEFYQRIVVEDSPYEIFSSELIIVYRLWANTGSHQMFVIRSIREFLKAKNRLGPLWNVDSLEPFLMCNLHTEYDMLHTQPFIETEDYSDIEERMLARLHTELARIAPIAPPPDDMHIKETSKSSTSDSVEDKSVKILKPDHDYDIPSEVYYMQKREELEIHRLARYYHEKRTILQSMYKDPSDFEIASNPFYARLKEIQNSNSQERILRSISPKHVGIGGRQRPYSGTQFSRGNADSSTRTPLDVRPNEREARMRLEQDLLQNVLESIVSAADETHDVWSEYQECTRKILIEVSDLVRQVRTNQEEAERLAAEETPVAKSSFLPSKKQRAPKSAESGADDVESRMGVEVEDGEEEKEETEETKREHSIKLDVLNSKIVWGHGVPIVDEDGRPIGPYSPDRPHIPETTLQRLEYLLDKSNETLLGAFGIETPIKE